MKRFCALVLCALLTSGCAISRKDIDIEIGEGGSAQLKLPQVEGTVIGPFKYQSRRSISEEGETPIPQPVVPE